MVVSHRRKEIRDVVVVDPIPHVPSFALSYHEIEVSQGAELMRGGAPLETGCARELLDSLRTLQECVEQSDPARGGKDAHRLRDPRCLFS